MVMGNDCVLYSPLSQCLYHIWGMEGVKRTGLILTIISSTLPFSLYLCLRNTLSHQELMKEGKRAIKLGSSEAVKPPVLSFSQEDVYL